MATVQADAIGIRGASLTERRLSELFDQPRRLVVGPRAGLVRKQVSAALEALRQVDDRTDVADLRWTATGPSAAFFPHLDARVALTAIDDTTSLLILQGSYRPPLGRLGAAVDRLLLRRAARSTMRAAAKRLASRLAGDSTTGGTR